MRLLHGPIKLLPLILVFLNIKFLAGQQFDIEIVDQDKYVKKIWCAAFYNDHTIAFSGPNNHIHFLDLATLSVTREISGLKGYPDRFSFSSNKKWLVATSRHNEIKSWKAKSGKLKHSLGYYDEDYVSAKHISFSPRDKYFAVTHIFSCNQPLYHTKKGTMPDSIPALENECNYALAYQQNGRYIYGCGNSHTWLFDRENREFAKIKNTKELSVISDIELTPDDQFLAVGGRKGLAILNSDLSDHQTLTGHTDWINDLTFSQDGKLLYSCSGTMFGSDNTVRVWEVATGKCLKVFSGHQSDVNTIDESPNGKWIISSSDDCTMKIWDISQQKLLCTIVPMLIKDRVELFFYTPDEVFYGAEQIFSICTATNSSPKFKAGKSSSRMPGNRSYNSSNKSFYLKRFPESRNLFSANNISTIRS